MNFDIKIDDSKIKAMVKSFKAGFDKKLDETLYQAAGVGRRRIRERTLKGKEISGNPFAPYTSQYAEFRGSKGRSKKPNLNFSGEMLGSMIYSKGRGSAKIRFSRLTEAEKAARNQVKRPFFGLNKDDKAYLMRFIRNRFK